MPDTATCGSQAWHIRAWHIRAWHIRACSCAPAGLLLILPVDLHTGTVLAEASSSSQYKHNPAMPSILHTCTPAPELSPPPLPPPRQDPSVALWHAACGVASLALEEPWLAADASDGSVMLIDTEAPLAAGGRAAVQRQPSAACRQVGRAGWPAYCVDVQVGGGLLAGWGGSWGGCVPVCCSLVREVWCSLPWDAQGAAACTLRLSAWRLARGAVAAPCPAWQGFMFAGLMHRWGGQQRQVAPRGPVAPS
jgi:hypothetical protein